MEVESIQCSPCQVVNDVVNLMGVRAAGKNLSLDIEYQFPVPAQVRSDSVRLRQILMNLVGNAIKFTEHGGVKVILHCDRVSGADPEKIVGRILLAEDGPDNQRLIGTHLRRAGAELTIVDNGHDAFEAALLAQNSGRPFAVILMDMQMPILDGYSATTKLREA